MWDSNPSLILLISNARQLHYTAQIAIPKEISWLLKEWLTTSETLGDPSTVASKFRFVELTSVWESATRQPYDTHELRCRLIRVSRVQRHRLNVAV